MSSRKGDRNDFDLYENEEDKERLSAMDDYSREKELTRRFDQKLRERQREELLGVRQAPVNEDRGGSIKKSTTGLIGSSERACSPSLSKYSSGGVRDDVPATSFAGGVSIESQGNDVPGAGAFETTSDGDGASADGTSTLFRSVPYDTYTNEKLETIAAVSQRKQQRLLKRVERAVHMLTAPLLEAIRLTPPRIHAMQEHPQVAKFLHGCLVRIPRTASLEACIREGRCSSSWRGSSSEFVGRVVALQTVAPIESVCTSVSGGHTPPGSGAFLFDLIVTPLDDPKLKIRVAVGSIAEFPPFDDDDLKEMRYLLRSTSDLEFSIAFPRSARLKAQELREFSFTETDVAEVLERKWRQLLESGTPVEAGANGLAIARPRAKRALFQRKEDVVALIHQAEHKLQLPTTSGAVRREQLKWLEDLHAELDSITLELEHIGESASQESFKLLAPPASPGVSPRANVVPVLRPPSRTSGGAAPSSLFIRGGGGGRGSVQLRCHQRPYKGSTATAAMNLASQNHSSLPAQGGGQKPNATSCSSSVVTDMLNSKGLLRLVKAVTQRHPDAQSSDNSKPLTSPRFSVGAAPALSYHLDVSNPHSTSQPDGEGGHTSQDPLVYRVPAERHFSLLDAFLASCSHFYDGLRTPPYGPLQAFITGSTSTLGSETSPNNTVEVLSGDSGPSFTKPHGIQADNSFPPSGVENKEETLISLSEYGKQAHYSGVSHSDQVPVVPLSI